MVCTRPFKSGEQQQLHDLLDHHQVHRRAKALLLSTWIASPPTECWALVTIS